MDKHAAGYIRVSSEEQAVHGISVDAQRAILEGWAAMTQAGPVEIYEDAGFSGKNTQRPALQRLLADVRAGRISVLAVWKLDRLSRSLRDTLTIIEDDLQPHGVTLVSTTESIDTSSPSGRMMLNMLASFAQLEREQDSDRVLMAHRHLAEDCRYLGGHIPIGYRVDDSRHYQLDPATAPIVRRVFEMYLSREGYTPILAYLNNASSEFFKRKTPWKKVDLNYLLGNEFYAGVYTRRLGKESLRVPGGVPAIITEEEWTKVCSIRAENRASDWRAYRTKRCDILAGKVFCAECGNKMGVVYAGKDRDGTNQRYYVCRGCGGVRIRVEKAEQLVISALESLAGMEAEIVKACYIANGYIDAEAVDRAADIVPIEEKITAFAKRRSSLIEFVASSGASAPASLAAELKRLDTEINGLQASLAHARRPVAHYDPSAIMHLLRAVVDNKKTPPEALKSAIQAAVFRVSISHDDVAVALTGQCVVEMTQVYIVASLPTESLRKQEKVLPRLLVLRGGCGL